MIKVFLVEDQGLVRDAIAALLGLDFNIEVIGQACDGQAARLDEVGKAGARAGQTGPREGNLG